MCIGVNMKDIYTSLINHFHDKINSYLSFRKPVRLNHNSSFCSMDKPPVVSMYLYRIAGCWSLLVIVDSCALNR